MFGYDVCVIIGVSTLLQIPDHGRRPVCCRPEVFLWDRIVRPWHGSVGRRKSWDIIPGECNLRSCLHLIFIMFALPLNCTKVNVLMLLYSWIDTKNRNNETGVRGRELAGVRALAIFICRRVCHGVRVAIGGTRTPAPQDHQRETNTFYRPHHTERRTRGSHPRQ